MIEAPSGMWGDATEVDPDPEGDLMWWQCRPPPCLLHFGVAWLVLPHFRQYAKFVPYQNGSHMPLRYHHGFTAVQADPELANADTGSTAGITPKKYGDSTTGGKAPNLVGVSREEEGLATSLLLLPSCQRREQGKAAAAGATVARQGGGGWSSSGEAGRRRLEQPR
ncbi:hypothetical protein Taro_011425 [Colocasia esculenta]|uniref:Uncharacterized protein n=1 Tax=Colocasia esculenta TaxID=4460 RepID=A0A843UCK5_COLES|nr:hypothetical protein [Colocasia esculenta]